MESTTTTPTTTAVKNPPEEPEPVNPTREKPLSFTNGVLKLHQHTRLPHAPPQEGAYRECLKNHAAGMGGHALDGCGEFMPSPSSLLCAACSCHRNFHRRDHTPTKPHHTQPHTLPTEFQPLHRHHAPPQPTHVPPRSPNSTSPPPISATYYPSAPHILLALSSNPSPNVNANPTPTSSARKRFRTRFTQLQREKMFEFAEKLGWKMQRRDEEAINGFCNSIGVEKGVFKVWMHNNKNTLGKGESANGNGINLDNSIPRRNHHHEHNGDEVSGNRVGTNGSCSSS